jgi:UDP-glucose 4-epimerase
MRCLVLGGAGFLGSHLCDGLLESGYQVRIFEKENVNKANISHIIKSVELIEGDFVNSSQLDAAVNDVDIVFHLVSTTLPKGSNENPVYDLSTNVSGTLCLLDMARKKQVKKLVFFSSGGTVYGLPKTVPIKEGHPTDPICSYGIHKLTIEKYLGLYHHLYGLDYVIMRIANPYGERQKTSSRQGAVSVFLERAQRGDPIEIWGDGSVVRDYLHVSDVIRAAMAAISYSGEHRIFNIGSGRGHSLNEVVKVIERVIGYSVEVRHIRGRDMDVPVNVLDIALARNELLWTPQIDFEDGLQRMAEYLKNERCHSRSFT